MRIPTLASWFFFNATFISSAVVNQSLWGLFFVQRTFS
ncbi:hypothetical protein ACINWC743_A0354 [Acinetobacter sp. WC-743]|nr:hypothetical protein ACINWC743_A0354 [Acinetobacter sp. WC-743]